MIDIIRKELQPYSSIEDRFNHGRELIQILALKIISDNGYFKNIVFTGGTALRVLYDLRRFSEDLDFSLADKKSYAIANITSSLKRHFRIYGIDAEATPDTRGTIHRISLKFTAILAELNLSRRAGQKMLINIEIDTNPPKGGIVETSAINRLFMFPVTHYDLPSLFATKLHSCFYRPFFKGRDFYDLLWYLSRRTLPNYKLLNNAIRQTHLGERRTVTDENLPDFIREKLTVADFKKIKRDIERFIENKDELKLLTREHFIGLLKRNYA